MENIRQDQNKKADALSKLASMAFSKLAKEILVEVIHEKSIVGKEVTNIIKEEGENWMAPIREYLLLGNSPTIDPHKQRASLRRYTKVVISDNRKQFIEGTFLVFCQKLSILQAFTSVYHPQANGQVEVSNRDIVKGMEQRLVSSDSLEESVGTSTGRVILFSTIHVILPDTTPTDDSPVLQDGTPLPTEIPTIPPITPTIQYTSPFIFTDSSDSDSFDRPSSPTDSVPSATPVLGALTSVRADLLLPHKRIRGSVAVPILDDDLEDSYETYTEPDIDSDIQADIDACMAAADAIAARETSVRVEIEVEIVRDNKAGDEVESIARGTIEIGVDPWVKPVVADDIPELVREDFSDLVSADRSLEVKQRGLDVVMQELHDHLVEIPVHRVMVIENVQREQGHRIMVTSQQSVAMSERIGMLERDNIRLRGMLDVERQRVDHLRRSMSYA
ncbi:putative reverse transcriptase domain-containing protein [Tanacetum coccineum]